MSPPDTTNGRPQDRPPANLTGSYDSVTPWTWMTTTVIELTSGGRLSTADFFALMARVADWRRIDGSHWLGDYGGKPAAFVLDEPRLERIEKTYGLTARALRYHCRRLADKDLAHLCIDGRGAQPRLVTLFPVERAGRPCPGCRPELSTVTHRRSNRHSSSGEPTYIVGSANSETVDDQQKPTPDPGKSQLRKSYEESRTSEETDTTSELQSLEGENKRAAALAKAILDPAGTAKRIAELSVQLDSFAAAAKAGEQVDRDRYFALSDELEALEQARAS